MASLSYFTFITLVLIALMVPMVYQILTGKTIVDKMIGANIIGTKTTVLLLFIGVLYERLDMFVDLAITYSLLNYITSLATSRYIQRRRSLAVLDQRPIKEDDHA